MAQGDAAFPRNIELLGWDTLLRSLVVLILSTNGSIYTDHTRMYMDPYMTESDVAYPSQETLEKGSAFLYLPPEANQRMEELWLEVKTK